MGCIREYFFFKLIEKISKFLYILFVFRIIIYHFIIYRFGRIIKLKYKNVFYILGNYLEEFRMIL